jgi:hypothetical protein
MNDIQNYFNFGGKSYLRRVTAFFSTKQGMEPKRKIMRNKIRDFLFTTFDFYLI